MIETLDIPIGLDMDQKAAAESHAPKTLVLAGAGSGKTKTIIGRIKHLVESGVTPRQIMVVTYTNTAADVLTKRLGFKVGLCGTIHASLLKIINRNPQIINYSPRVTVVDEEYIEAMIEDVAKARHFTGSAGMLRDAWAGRTDAKLANAILVTKAVRRLLWDSNAMDFDTILTKGTELIQFLSERLEWPYTHLLWDEAQDMSEQCRKIFDSIPAKTKFAVGDFNQAIFSFLGGASDNLKKLAENANIIRLEKNYRSGKAICNAANAVCAALGSDMRAIPREAAPNGSVTIQQAKDEQEEFLAIAMAIRALKCENSCAVLLRTNKLADQYRAALESHSIPVAKTKSNKDPEDWKLVKALLAWVGNPSSDVLAEQFLKLNGKSQTEIDKIKLDASKAGSINQYLGAIPFQEFTALDAIQFVQSYLTKCSTDSVRRLSEAAAILDEASTIGDLIIALADKPKEEIERPGVMVTTYHSAKGMEWNVVFLPAMEQGIMPLRLASQTEEGLQEERRTFYVGLTRAEDHVIITSVKWRNAVWPQREGHDAIKSQFITKIENQNVKTNTAVSQ